MPLFEVPERWTVSRLTAYLVRLFEEDDALQDVWVEGEISNLSRPSSGHVYFTLKDSSASLRCVMWRSDASRLRFNLQDGAAVEAHGKISVYQAAGQYQLYADLLRPVGEGALFQEFLRLKALLEARGLFDPARKRPIPELPECIGIVTSPTGAALRDMLRTIQRRMPLVRVILAPSPVQGEEAPAAIVDALQRLDRIVGPDVILLARGGGSIEDLWAFNDERVVTAVTESRTPVISGVGHETDFTLVDFAADLRAPTPTAAAELATSISLDDLKSRIDEMNHLLVNDIQSAIGNQRTSLETLRLNLLYQSPLQRVRSDRQRLDELSRQLNSLLVHRLILAREQIKGLKERLHALNPAAVLARGYAIVMKEGEIVSSQAQVQVDDRLRVRLQDGEFGARVTGSE